MKLQEREWFAARPEITSARTAAERRRRIESLRESNPAEYAAFAQARRLAGEASRFIRESGLYPLCGRGDVNTYAAFAELSRRLIRPGGRVGLIVPSGLVTDDTTRNFFRDLLDAGSLVRLLDFHNGRRLFPGVQANVKFCLLTLAGERRDRFEIAARLAAPDDRALPGRLCTLTPDDVQRINPNTLTCPMFSGVRDAALVRRLHERFPVLVRERDPASDPWGLRPGTMFHMTNDSSHFRTLEQLRADGCRLRGNVLVKKGSRYLPLIEAKLVRRYDHRAATFAGVSEEVRYRTHARTRETTAAERADPAFRPLPRYWVPEEDVIQRAAAARWFLGFRNAISPTADARSLVAAVIPPVGVGNSLPLIRTRTASDAACLLAVLNSFVLDYVLRQKAGGGNLNFFILKQLPVPSPDFFDLPCAWKPGQSLRDWFVPRVVELTYTAADLEPFARDCGHVAAPYPWDEERRHRLRCELDAALFRLYGLSENEVNHVLDAFRVFERKEAALRCHPGTRETILSAFDALAGGPSAR